MYFFRMCKRRFNLSSTDCCIIKSSIIFLQISNFPTLFIRVFRMSITSIAPISFHEDGIDKRGELDLTESHLVFKSGFQDRLNLAYSNIREYRQSEAQGRISRFFHGRKCNPILDLYASMNYRQSGA